MSELSPETNLIIAHILDPYEDGQEFRSWARHITLMPWFETNAYNQLIDSLRTLAGKTTSIVTTVEEWDFFGPKNDVSVQRVLKSEPFSEFHESLLTVVQEFGQVQSTKFTGENFKPHITKQNTETFEEGRQLVINDFCLIAAERGRKAREHGIKTIIGTYALR